LRLFFVSGCAIYESNYFGDHEQPTTHVEIYQDTKFKANTEDLKRINAFDWRKEFIEIINEFYE